MQFLRSMTDVEAQIKQWLQKGEPYPEGLQLFAKYVKLPVLQRTLSHGPNTYNCGALRDELTKAMRNARTTAPKTPAQPKPVPKKKVKVAVPKPSKDQEARELVKELAAQNEEKADNLEEREATIEELEDEIYDLEGRIEELEDEAEKKEKELELASKRVKKWKAHFKLAAYIHNTKLSEEVPVADRREAALEIVRLFEVEIQPEWDALDHYKKHGNFPEPEKPQAKEYTLLELAERRKLVENYVSRYTDKEGKAKEGKEHLFKKYQAELREIDRKLNEE